MASTPITPTQPTQPTPPTATAQLSPGTQVPNQIELLWDRYKSIAYVVIFAILGAIGINIGLEKWNQSKVDETWTSFASNIGLDSAYSDSEQPKTLLESLATIDPAKLKDAAQNADDVRKPWLLFAIARRAVLDKDWAAAEAALSELESKYPKHDLVRTTPHPVQTQDEIFNPDEAQPKPGTPPKPREKKPAVAGSEVNQLRAEIAAAKAFSLPAQFAPVPLAEGAERYKFELSNSSSFTIAIEADKAPTLAEKFKALATAEPPFWVGTAIDEIRRPTKTNKQPHELHFGLESTRGQDDRDKWTDTEPSKNAVDAGRNDLSHFPGAVSARPEKDNRSAADRIWITVDDAPQYDGERVVFGRVVEGLDALKKICESSMTATEEEQGRGKPSDTIRITGVTLVK